MHIAIGLIFVLASLVLAVAALGASRAGTRALPVVAIVWAVIVNGLGFAQTELDVGTRHRVVQVLHLLVGLVAIALGETLVVRLPRA